jgi:hypothetical protein
MARTELTVDEIIAILPGIPGRIAEMTASRNRTVRFYGDGMAAHEREHPDQIANTVAAVRGS